MPESGTFQPNWVSPPGDTIAELLVHRSLSLVDFAERIGTPVDKADELARGLVQIDRPLAERLERALVTRVTLERRLEERHGVVGFRLRRDLGLADLVSR